MDVFLAFSVRNIWFLWWGKFGENILELLKLQYK
jgi:hypothetical protein